MERGPQGQTEQLKTRKECIMRGKSFAISALIVGAAAGSAFAAPLTVGFQNISGNSATNIAIGESQYKLTISEMGADVNFRFFHDGSAASSIAQIYFDDRSPRLGAATLTGSGAGVVFGPNGSPPVLPAANNASPAFSVTKRFSANNPAPSKGINPGEYLDIKFALLSGDFDALLGDVATGKLRVGMHVIAFANGGSESFVNGNPPPTAPVPLPTPVTLAGAGLVGLAAIRRRR